MDNNYAPNSHKARETNPPTADRRRVEKVVKGVAKTKKKSEVRKLTDIFVSEDAANVKSYILMDVLVPAIKKALSDIVVNGIDMILYGEKGRSGKRSTSSSVSYRYDKAYDDNRRYEGSRARTVGYSHDDVILETRSEAEEIITRMDELIETYGIVSVADLYDLAGLTCNYTDNKYGWTSIRSVEAVRVRDGWMLKLPKALPLN